MTTDQPLKCPVCSTPFTPGQPRCANPDCGWLLNSGPVLGRLTAEEMQAFQHRLTEARKAYRRKTTTELPITLETARQVVKLKHQRIDEVRQLVLSPNGEMLAAASSSGIICYDTKDFAKIDLLKTRSEVRRVTFSPDGSFLVCSLEDKTVLLWSVSEKKQLRTIGKHAKWVNSVAFSPTSNLIATASDDHTIRLWKVTDGLLYRTLKGHSKCVNSVAF